MQQLPAWGQRHDESEPAWGAFKVYRDMGAQRSLKRVARAVGKSQTLMENWSRRHSWVRRCELWDQAQHELERDARIAAIAAATEKHGKLGEALLAEVAKDLADRRKRGGCKACGRKAAKPLTDAQLASWMRTGVDIQRTALGLGSSSAGAPATVNVTTNVQAGATTNLVLLRDAEAQQLASALLGRMRSLDPAASLRRLGQRQAAPALEAKTPEEELGTAAQPGEETEAEAETRIAAAAEGDRRRRVNMDYRARLEREAVRDLADVEGDLF